jgi:hypothetical protein
MEITLYRLDASNMARGSNFSGVDFPTRRDQPRGQPTSYKKGTEIRPRGLQGPGRGFKVILHLASRVNKE